MFCIKKRIESLSVVIMPFGASAAGTAVVCLVPVEVLAAFAFFLHWLFRRGGLRLWLCRRGLRLLLFQPAPFGGCGRSLAGAELGSLRMFGIVHFVYLENFLPPDDDQACLIGSRRTSSGGEDRTLADTEVSGIPACSWRYARYPAAWICWIPTQKPVPCGKK